MPHPMFARHVVHLEAIRSQRMLDQIQIDALPHMKDHDRRRFIERLVDGVQGTVAAVPDDDGIAHEQVIWNGKPLGTTREIKQAAFSTLAKGLVA
jgi:hypothetical protein